MSVLILHLRVGAHRPVNGVTGSLGSPQYVCWEPSFQDWLSLTVLLPLPSLDPRAVFQFLWPKKKALISIYAHLMPELALLHRREVCCLHLCACWVNRHFLQTLLPFACRPRGKWEVAMEGCVLGFCWTVCQVSSCGLKGDKSPSPQSSWLLPQPTQQTKANYLCSDINIYV